MKVYHLNCLNIESPFGKGIGHCILIESHGSLTLIDSGIGLIETQNPEKTLGKDLIEQSGFKLTESQTAVRQIEQLGLDPRNVDHIICSHLDPDHIGGLSDFPTAIIHLSKEEFDCFHFGNERYLPYQLANQQKMKLYSENDSEWYGLPARKLNVNFEAYLIPLFGHTLGHCGVVFSVGDRWTFYVGDAYYLRAELIDENNPVDQLATIRSINNDMRIQTLKKLKIFINEHGNKFNYFGYHDPLEFIS
jgi:glyoxylase-like metal-dependent hydrolase (beta-lactamase superfamily II)